MTNLFNPLLFPQGNSFEPKDKDPTLKGIEGGNCNVTICQKPNAFWYNKPMQKWYCSGCAREINKACRYYGTEEFCTLGNHRE